MNSQTTVSASTLPSLNIVRAAAQIRHEIGAHVEFHYALKAASGYGDKLSAILKAHKADTDRDAVRLEMARQYKARDCRRPSRIGRLAAGLTFGRPAVKLHGGCATIAEHLRLLRIHAVSQATHNALRCGDILKIVLTDDPGKVRAAYSSRSLGQYSSRCSYTQYETTLTVTVPSRWRTRVERRGLAVVDGMMTLDAAECDYRIDGVTVFAATWVTQGRGYSCSVVHGFIARTLHFGAPVTCHADTAAKAVAGLKRKAAWTALTAKEKSARVHHLTDWTLRTSKAPADTPVCVSDARATGSCEYGIQSWCNRVGIDYDAGCATLTQVLAAYAEYPLPEVRAAVLYAIRHNR